MLPDVGNESRREGVARLCGPSRSSPRDRGCQRPLRCMTGAWLPRVSLWFSGRSDGANPGLGVQLHVGVFVDRCDAILGRR